LLDLFQTLGIEQAHIAAGGAPVLTDWHGLATHHVKQRILATLTGEEAAEWRSAVAQAEADGTQWAPNPLSGRAGNVGW
jgi:hypothetical protein